MFCFDRYSLHETYEHEGILIVPLQMRHVNFDFRNRLTEWFNQIYFTRNIANYAREIEIRGLIDHTLDSVIILAHNVWTGSSNMYIPMTRPFSEYQQFYPVTLTLEFDLCFRNCNLADNFSSVIAAAIAFNMSTELKYCRYGVKLFPINQSINMS